MVDSQNVKYKEPWWDEYLEWECGFEKDIGIPLNNHKKDEMIFQKTIDRDKVPAC